MRKRSRECPLCGVNSRKVICKLKNTMSEEERICTNYPTNYAIVVCEKCGMVYTDINVKATDVESYYTKYNIYSNMSGIKSDLYLKTMEMYFDSILKYISSESSIVDVGCGSGDLLDMLRKKGYLLVNGIDPSKDSIDCLEKKGVKGRVGTIYSCDENDDNKYDMVISTGVLEHLLYPQEALIHMKKLLNKDGYMYICIPATEKYMDDVQPVANYFNHEHINHFTEKTLIEMAERIGLAVVESKVQRACNEIEATLNIIFKVDGEVNANSEIVRYDSSGRDSIEKYFIAIKERELKNEFLLKEIIESQREIIVWGTGNYASSLMNMFPELKNNISFFVDNNESKINTWFYGKKIYEPKMICTASKEAIVIVCVMQSKKEVERDVLTLNIKNKVVYF